MAVISPARDDATVIVAFAGGAFDGAGSGAGHRTWRVTYRRTIVLIAATVLQGLAVHASAGAPDLARFPVDRVQTVALSECRDGVELAARGASPLEIALAVARPFEGSIQQIIQANDRSENPSSSRVVVLRDGLLDDAIRSERWEIALERTAAGAWTIRSVNRAWRCRRGEPRDAFGVASCR